jgi:hypothetical protein
VFIKCVKQNQALFGYDQGRRVSHIGSQSGQAVVEYILVLVVVVGIALGVMYQLNTALKKYVQSYFGDYVSCLLEMGELPSFGGASGANSETCASLYEPFSLQNGRPLIASSGGNGDNGDGDSNSSRSASRGYSGSRVTRNNSSLNADRNAPGQVAGTVGGKSKKELQGYSGGGDASTRYSTKSKKGGMGSRVYTKLKMDPKEKVLNKKIDLQGALSGRNARKIAVDMDKFRPKTPVSDTSFGLSFGDYIRYLLIFGIIIVILIFFGGQINQLRKSWEN